MIEQLRKTSFSAAVRGAETPRHLYLSPPTGSEDKTTPQSKSEAFRSLENMIRSETDGNANVNLAQLILRLEEQMVTSEWPVESGTVRVQF